MATIIASQAIITGSFSMTRQAMQLGWLPGLQHPPDFGRGLRPDLCAGRELADDGSPPWRSPWLSRSSDRLAGAYGTAVSTTMLMTTAFLYPAMSRGVALVARLRWRGGRFPRRRCHYFAANFLKIAEGGWLPSARRAGLSS